MHKLHRITNLQTSNKKHHQKIKDHVKNLLKKSHTVWDESIPHFKASSKQKQQLDKIEDVPIRNRTLAQMEREYLEPKEQEQLLKNQLRKNLQAIIDEETKKSSRSTICAKETLYNVFSNSDERQKVRQMAQHQHQARVGNEQKLNQLGIQLAQTQQRLLHFVESIEPQLSIFLGLQNLERVININESLEAYPNLLQNQIAEETLDCLQNDLLCTLSTDPKN